MNRVTRPLTFTYHDSSCARITSEHVDANNKFSLIALSDNIKAQVPVNGGYRAGKSFTDKAASVMGSKQALTKEEFKDVYLTMEHMMPEGTGTSDGWNCRSHTPDTNASVPRSSNHKQYYPLGSDFDEVFTTVDADGNGTIDMDELSAFLGDPRIALHRRVFISSPDKLAEVHA